MSTTPRLILAGLSGGAGKTIISLGLCRSLVDKGLRVKPFKKGPDYIDAAWLGLAARREASNLDPFMMPTTALLDLYSRGAAGVDMALVEGNRGLFDGKDVNGSYSTAELAKLLQAPVVLIVNCTKMTRTVVAMILGCRAFEPNLHLAGVILNRTAGKRHKTILRQCIEQYTDVPVVGILPKIDPDPIPERHMGLVSNQECSEAETTLDLLANIARDCIDLDAIRNLATNVPPLDLPQPLTITTKSFTNPSLAPEDANSGFRPTHQEFTQTVRIGVIRDAALWFYYRENLEELRTQGAELVELSLLSANPWPEIHGLYLGGGFPETQAAQLSQNTSVRDDVARLAHKGLPIYAECGGFMYLGESLVCRDSVYPMAGVFPLQTMLCAKPQGLGYTVARVIHPNPFHPVGLEFTGHEFHYSKCVTPLRGDMQFALEMKRGCGMDQNRDGLTYKNTFACYTHLHALGVPTWARSFVAAARSYQRENLKMNLEA
ncbi:cobyrinic acid a,c-diamide synthase [Desulfonatronum thiosulfatophilum]|uniref:Cobyrinate a,c-diamide synthase n=1 Tax=Desulfonatronum thiosulfatophilum TaxID=617002 RepID=A0A1G6D789_9BACT|nr:cobyrinate a,c-diamide synthase [Desulfonatronum thiosulfatophilum]SDB41013.1 cobyrinic acid a,c-diamide synthase [Desulfonatronum thiosulfatophilum]